MPYGTSPHCCRRVLGALAAALVAASIGTPCLAQKIQMKDGRIYEGQLLPMTGVSDPPPANDSPDEEAPSTPILLIDDGLRRVFVPKANVAAIVDEAPANPIKITLWQNTAQAGSTLASVGPSLNITPFDKFGRRIYEMQTHDGPLAIVQGITELTPRYAKVEGLIGQPRTIVWDMRLATTSIPRDILEEILATAVSRDDPQAWVQIVRFYLQGEQYGEALAELEAIIAAYPDRKDLQDVAKELRRKGADRILREIELRRQAGQHELAGRLLENFPTEDVSGETLQQVREALAEYEADQTRLKKTAAQLRTLLAELKAEDTRAVLKPVVEEMLKRLSFNNVGRFTPFNQLADDASLSAEQKLALAVSGWILGPNDAVSDLSVALAMVTVRQVVHKYLNEPLAHERTALLDSIRTLQGVTVPRVAAIIANLAPPWEIPKEASQGQGAYELTAPGHTEDGDFHYLVQTPPEYDPDRRYPTLLVLNGSTNSPQQELEFWAGSRPADEEGKTTGPRVGQAMRHGYLVIAVDWLKPKQYSYEYSFREHAAVLTTLRDACRRFSIDTDRVFLSGHGIGGEAAWDLAQAHPDLWAGVLPFAAQFSQKEKFVQHYWDNAAYVPLYFVCGELDSLKMSLNAQLLDQYLKKRFPTTVVEFHGRGYEPFHDAIIECFDWMDRQVREWPPKDFECNTMRAWDNFFWWVEGQGFPDAITPGNWPRRNARPTLVEGRLLNGNRLSARTACDQTLLWLRPDMVDFNQPIRVTLNGNRVKGDTEPSLEVLLEDTRTRADRQRPFWAKLQVP